MATQQEIAARIITQLKTADPSISAIVGTPERKIIDSVAEVLAQAQVDINMLNGAFDVDSKYGSDLDNMLGLFGFGRQQAVKASGYVEFSRTTASSIAVPIPAGTQLKAMGAANGADVAFITTRSVTLASNSTVVLAPVECIISGSVGNVAANSITDWNGAAITGIDALTNPSITYGGVDSENDDQVKARFKVAGPFRNLAGTKDQYLSLALGTKSTKANVIGPVSQYTEYVQVPLYPDNNGGNGSKGTEYTTALSTNVNSKHFYENLAKFISDDTVSIPVVFNENFDFVINNDGTIKKKGDSYRNYIKGADADPLSISAKYRPNVTFTNVYTGTGDTNQTISSGNVLLFEHYYMSSASRNDYDRGVLNCVDLFVNGSDETLATATIPRPGNGIPAKIFTDVDKYDSLYYDNFRRTGSPTVRPVPSNIFVPLPHQPVLDVPDTIVVAAGTFRKNVHYWAVEEVTNLRGTVRARNGLELSVQTKAQSSQDPDAGPYTGPKITDNSGSQTSLVLSIDSTGTNIVVDSTTAGGLFGSGTLTIDDEQINYEKTTANTWSNAATYTSGTLSSSITSDAASIAISTTTAPPSGSTQYLLVDKEIISYTTVTESSSPWTISGVQRGVNGTTASTHSSGAVIGSYVIYKDSSDLNAYLYQCISPVTTAGTTPKTDLGNKWTTVGLSLTAVTNGRGVNGTTASAHQSGAIVGTPFASTDNLLSIENYVYDANIYNLQNSLESNKQITTDVLAHKAKVRYFKPDVSIMYSKGSNPSGVNKSIISALNNYFDNQYFGSTIQLSDILQIIHNVPGVDNVRWSKDALVSKNLSVDSNYDPRNKLSEVDPYGDSPKVVLQQVRATDGSNKTVYRLYLSTNASTITSIKVSRPSTSYTTSATGTSGQKTIVVTSNTGFATGMSLSGTNVATGTIITSVSGTTIGLSIALTGNVNNNVTASNSYTSTNAKLDSITGLKPNTSYTISSTSINNNLTLSTDKVISFKTGSLTNSDSNLAVDGSYIITLSSATSDVDDFVAEVCKITEFIQGKLTFQYGDVQYSMKLDTTANGGQQLTTTTLGTLFSNFATVSASSPSNFPTIDNPYTINYINGNDVNLLTVVDGGYLSDSSWVYNNDFLLGDNELAALPIGMTDSSNNVDPSSVITIRAKAQNTWDQI